jgi:hypothetical protein
MNPPMRQPIIALLLMAGLMTMGPSSTPPHEFIRVVQENGVWWFEDGSGARFFSLGVNCIGGCYGHAEESPLAPSRQRWIVERLKAWGFNTAGSWSSPSVWEHFYVADQIYLTFHETQHDVFDESLWRDQLIEEIAREVQTFTGRKNFLGYFLDNERAWKAQEVFEFYLQLPKGTPGSRAFVTYIKGYYHDDLGQLNAEWSTAYVSFEHIAGSSPPTIYSRTMHRGILPAWRTEVAATYYRRYTETVRALDPHHLILGIRYQGVPNRDLFITLSPLFDVNSINDYSRYGHLKPIYAEFYQATGKPLMVTEFSFSGFPHPGQLSDLFVDVYQQEHRGLGYYKYVQQAARAPFMVGMHWFMWMDYAEDTGANGGYPYPPDRNVGLVSNDESMIYEALVRWVMRANQEVEAAQRGALGTERSALAPPQMTVTRFTPVLDGDLAEWPKDSVFRPTAVNALADDIQLDHRYFLAQDEQGLYLAAEIIDASLEPTQLDRPWLGDQLALRLNPLIPIDGGLGEATQIIIYPIGAGPDQQQPYAVQGYEPRHHQRLPLQVVKGRRPGGYTIEAHIPATALKEFHDIPGPSWQLQLWYQNVGEIYQSSWEGIVTIEP